MVPSLDRVEAKYDPWRAANDAPIWAVRYVLWVQYQMEARLCQLRGLVTTMARPMKTRGSHANLARMRRNGMALGASMVLRQALASIALLRRRRPTTLPLRQGTHQIEGSALAVACYLRLLWTNISLVGS